MNNHVKNQFEKIYKNLHGLQTAISLSLSTSLITWKPENFETVELVHPRIFSDFGEASLQFFDPRILWTIDAIRKYFNSPVYVNNWDSGGSLKNRGLRTFDSTTGSFFSMHKFGKAIDFTVAGQTPVEIRNWIKEKHGSLECLQFITRIEDFDGMTWVHIDCANVTSNELLVFSK